MIYYDALLNDVVSKFEKWLVNNTFTRRVCGFALLSTARNDYRFEMRSRLLLVVRVLLWCRHPNPIDQLPNFWLPNIPSE